MFNRKGYLDEETATIIALIIVVPLALVVWGLQKGWFDWVGTLISTVGFILKLMIFIGAGLVILYILYRIFEPKEKKKVRKRQNADLAKRQLKYENEKERKKSEKQRIIKTALKEHFEHKYKRKIKHLSKTSRNYFINTKVKSALEEMSWGDKKLEDFIGSHVDRKVRIRIPAKLRRAVYRAYHLCPICRIKDLQEIHHIDKNPSNNYPTNLIALCAACHRKDLSSEVYRAKWKKPINPNRSPYGK